MYDILAVLAAFALIYSIVAGGAERTWISGPIVFTVLGLLIGPFGARLISTKTDPELLKTLAELTLAIVLFTDAAEADLGVLRRTRLLPMRLLGFGLPLTILLGFGFGWLLFARDLSLLEIALLATMLAPTDAALGKAVITNEAVPAPIRQGLNVESGLNDGICVPIVLLFLDLMSGQGGGEGAWYPGLGLSLFAEAVGIGLVMGAVLSGAAVWMLHVSRRRGWLSPAWIKVTVVALALACFGAAQTLGGSGFIASFSGGLLFGALLKPHHEPLLNAAEGIGDCFALLTWVLFGAAVVGQVFTSFDWPILLYAALSLTVIRMVPVFVSVAGLGIGTEGKLFLGWFGPRGLASIVFVVIVINKGVPGSPTIGAVVACTVILSIVGHGVTANPWAKAYGPRARALPGAGGAPAGGDADEPQREQLDL